MLNTEYDRGSSSTLTTTVLPIAEMTLVVRRAICEMAWDYMMSNWRTIDAAVSGYALKLELSKKNLKMINSTIAPKGAIFMVARRLGLMFIYSNLGDIRKSTGASWASGRHNWILLWQQHGVWAACLDYDWMPRCRQAGRDQGLVTADWWKKKCSQASRNLSIAWSILGSWTSRRCGDMVQRMAEQRVNRLRALDPLRNRWHLRPSGRSNPYCPSGLFIYIF